MRAQAITREPTGRQATQRGMTLFIAMLMGAAVLLTTGLKAEARGAPESFADLAEKASPAVVNITTTTIVEARAGGPQPMVPEGSPFEEFFRDFLDRDQRGNHGDKPRRSQALGSGFVISEDGFIVTNNHVIEGADEIMIEFFGGEKELPAKVIGTDPNTDIALLKVESDEPLDFVKFGDSDVMRVGDWVMAVGNPLGQGFSVSAGIISARNRGLGGVYDDYIQTDAAINRGNSGGPLFSMDGEVIGVNTAILSPNGGSIGIGFSMSSNVVTKVVGQLKEFGETRRGWLGVRIQDITEDMLEGLNLSSTNGVLVNDVPEGPSKEAGIQAGDVIMSFDGSDVSNTRELVKVVGNAPVGKAVRVVVMRDGQTQTLKVTLGRREEAVASNGEDKPMENGAPMQKSVLGMTLGALDDAIRGELGLNPGDKGLAVLAVEEDSEAFEKGMRQGDVITEAGQLAVEDIAGFEKMIDEAREAGRKSMLLLVRRGGEPRFLALALK